MKLIDTKEKVNTVLNLMFGCAGCVVDNNALLYPSELEDGYDDDDANVLGFYMDEDYEYDILEVSVNGMIGSTLSDTGLISMPNGHSVQLLTFMKVEEFVW